MEIPVDDELREICVTISADPDSEESWCLRESDDEFQTEHYCGGFDADERAFCFSKFLGTGNEVWFQFTLREAVQIASGEIQCIRARPAG